MGQSLTEYNTSKKEDITIYKVDIVAQSKLAARLNVRSMPVLLYIKNGTIIAKEQGVKSALEIKQNVIKYLQ